MTTRETWRRAVATGLAALLALTACTGDTGQPSGEAGSAPAPAPAADTAPATFEGLYVTGDVALVSESTSQITLASGRPCPELSAMLAAGQWQRVDRLTFGKLGEQELALLAGFGGLPGDLLRRGDRLVFAGMEGGAACTATVSQVEQSEITLTGKGLPGKSPGWVATTRCYRSKADGALTVSFYYDTDGKVGGQGQIAFSRRADRYEATDDPSALTLTLLRHKGTFLDTMSTAYADLRRRPAGLRQLVAGNSFTGTATVRDAAAAVPAGTIDLAGLVDENGGGKTALSLPFSCPTLIEIR